MVLICMGLMCAMPSNGCVPALLLFVTCIGCVSVGARVQSTRLTIQWSRIKPHGHRPSALWCASRPPKSSVASTSVTCQHSRDYTTDTHMHKLCAVARTCHILHISHVTCVDCDFFFSFGGISRAKTTMPGCPFRKPAFVTRSTARQWRHAPASPSPSPHTFLTHARTVNQ